MAWFDREFFPNELPPPRTCCCGRYGMRAATIGIAAVWMVWSVLDAIGQIVQVVLFFVSVDLLVVFYPTKDLKDFMIDYYREYRYYVIGYTSWLIVCDIINAYLSGVCFIQALRTVHPKRQIYWIWYWKYFNVLWFFVVMVFYNIFGFYLWTEMGWRYPLCLYFALAIFYGPHFYLFTLVKSYVKEERERKDTHFKVPDKRIADCRNPTYIELMETIGTPLDFENREVSIAAQNAAWKRYQAAYRLDPNPTRIPRNIRRIQRMDPMLKWVVVKTKVPANPNPNPN